MQARVLLPVHVYLCEVENLSAQQAGARSHAQIMPPCLACLTRTLQRCLRSFTQAAPFWHVQDGKITL